MTPQHVDQDYKPKCSSVILQERSLVTAVEILDPTSIAISSANVSPYVRIYDFDGNEIVQCVGHTKGVWALNKVGDTLVSGGMDTTINFWNIHTGALQNTLHGHTGTIRSLQTLDTQTGQFVSASRDGTIRLWNTNNSQCEKSIIAHERGVRCLNHKDGTTASGGYDCQVRVWDVLNGHCLQTFEGHSATVHGVVFDSTRIAAGAEDGEVRVWDRASGTLLASLNNGFGIPAQIRARNGTLISTGKNGALTFWNKSWLGEDHTVLAHDSIIVALDMTDTDLFTGGMDGVVKKWDLQSGNLAQEMSTRYGNLHVIVVDQQVVIAVSTDDAHTALEIWSLASTAPDKRRATQLRDRLG